MELNRELNVVTPSHRKLLEDNQMAKKQRTTARYKGDNNFRLYDDVLSIASTLLRNRKEFGAYKLQSLAEATRSFGNSFSDMPNLKSHIASASQSIDDIADYVSHSDIAEIVHDSSVFARRHPLATLAGSVAIGLGMAMAMRPTNSTPTRAAKTKTKSNRKTKKAPPREKRVTNGSAHTNA
jgi:hypothetical protein